MRHANPDITRNVYVQTIPEAQKAAIRMLETKKKPPVEIVPSKVMPRLTRPV
jgi:hypothetical protein